MIRVIIERHIADDLEEHYEQAARSTLAQAMQAHGFVSGESLRNAFDHNHRIVLANYRSVQDWQRWYSSSERQSMMATISPMLQREEKITVLEQ
ncbi:antibiotic biosynthesis monooxygenase family protein [Aliamphritea spongicola]|uniref:antibiotic biosynthesis monooxygenase family protein n=1 Tax=Aliamphritea spongicola TaxID=707589 RepID=UPI00196A7EC6|nr:antibiotic biosynthesis monooxygenase [Aliamphritea spongicola]MBN3564815.1 antibiotic biosynthesis monooxygenase [Aliamphritea spongicola]